MSNITPEHQKALQIAEKQEELKEKNKAAALEQLLRIQLLLSRSTPSGKYSK